MTGPYKARPLTAILNAAEQPTQPADVASALIAVFGIGRCPTATAALTLALQQGGVPRIRCLDSPDTAQPWAAQPCPK